MNEQWWAELIKNLENMSDEEFIKLVNECGGFEDETSTVQQMRRYV